MSMMVHCNSAGATLRPRAPNTYWPIRRIARKGSLVHFRETDFSLNENTSSFAEDPPRIRRGLLRTQLLYPFPQVLVIDLEDDLRATIRSRKDICSSVLTNYRFARTPVEPHIP